MATLKGIDISYWQGNVDFSKVKNEVDFVIFREGYRTTIDSKFIEYVNGAKKNNIPIHGVYHFCYAINEEEVVNEAKSCIENIKKAGLGKDIIIFFDFEYDTVTKAKARGVTLGKTECTNFTVKFCEYVKSQGYTPGVYYNLDYMRNMYDMSKIKSYVQWLAQYNGGSAPSSECTYHQYGSDGKVSGISGNVDMNLCYKVTTTAPEKEVKKMTENELRSAVANWMVPYIGISEGSASHKNILAVFNNSGLCTRYKMTVNDAWCATAVSAAFIACGLAGKAGSGSLFECVECSCWYMVELAKKQGIWVENDAYVPKVGDVVLYDWDDSGVGDNTGSPDHVGIVLAVSGNSLTIIEGNYSNSVKKRALAVNGRYIRGYITPNYAKKAGTVTSTPTVSTPAASQTVTKPQSGSTFNKTCKFVGVVTADELNIRKGAGTDWEKCSFSPLKENTEVEVCDTCSNGWYYIKYNGKYGFCSNQYIKKKEITSAAPTTTTSGGLNRTPKWVGSVTADVLNVRTWAGTENPNIKSYPRLGKGNLIDVCDSVKAKNGDVWYYVRIAGKIYGFVHSDYIKRK